MESPPSDEFVQPYDDDHEPPVVTEEPVRRADLAAETSSEPAEQYSARLFRLAPQVAESLDGESRRYFEGYTALLKSYKENPAPPEVVQREGHFVNQFFYNRVHPEAGSLEKSLTAMVRTAADVSLTEDDSRRFAKLLEWYITEANERAEAIDRSLGIPEVPFGDPVYDLAWEIRMDDFHRLYFDFLAELPRTIGVEAADAFVQILDECNLRVSE